MDTAQVTALPPGINGVARGELVLELGVLTWSRSSYARNAPKKPHLLVRWWGDPGPGYHIQLTEGEATHFPICCAPKYFGRYLKDMGNLPLTLHGSGQVLGQASIDIRYLDVGVPIKGTFPVISLTGQHVASLEVSLQLFHDTPDNQVPIDKPCEHLTHNPPHNVGPDVLLGQSDGACPKPQQQPATALSRPPDPATSDTANLHTSTAKAEPTPQHENRLEDTQLVLLPPGSQQQVAAGGQAAPAPSPHLFELLHTSLSRDVDKCFTVFSLWETDVTSTRSLSSWLDLLHTHQILQTPLQQQQATYVVTLMDPVHDLILDMEHVLMALRQCLEVELRLSSGQVGTVLPQLVHIIQGIQQRGLSLKAALHVPATQEGQQGRMTVNGFVSWLQKELPPMDRQLLRYVVALLLHICSGPSGTVTYQDVLALEQLVLGQGAAPAPDMLGRNSQERRAAALQESHTALARLKRRRAVRPAVSSGGGASGLQTRTADAANDNMQGSRQTAEDQLPVSQAVMPGSSNYAHDGVGGKQDVVRPTDCSTVNTNSQNNQHTGNELHHLQVHDDMDRPGTHNIQHQNRIGSMDDIHRLLQEAGALQQQLVHAMTEADDFNDNSPPHRSRVRGSHLTSETLAALDSTAPPDVLLDILCDPDNDSHSSHSTSRHDLSPHYSPYASDRLMAGSRHVQVSRQRQRSLGSPVHIFTSTGTGFSSPNAHIRPRAYKRAASHNPDGYHTDQDSADTDEEGAAAFVEQQLMQHLFYNAVSPAARNHGLNGEEQAHVDSEQDEEDDDATSESSLPSQSKFEHMTKPAINKHEQVHSGLLVQVSELQLSQQLVSKPVGQFVLSARTTFTDVQCHCILSTDVGSLEAQLQWALAGSSSVDLLSAPPALLIIEVWQPPASCELSARQVSEQDISIMIQAITSEHARLVGIVSIPLTIIAALQQHTKGEHSITSPAEAVELAVVTEHTILSEGVFDVIDVLNDDVLGSVHITAKLVGCTALSRTTWHVTVCSAAGLPDADAMSAAGLPAPVSRHIKYLYPGEANPLITDDVPATHSPIFAATAMHTVVLPADTRPSQQLLLGAAPPDGSHMTAETTGQHQDAQLAFEVWDHWESGPDTRVASATLPLSVLLSAQPGTDVTQQLPLQLNTTAVEATLVQNKQQSGHSTSDGSNDPDTQSMITPTQPIVPMLEVRLRTESVMVGAYPTAGKEPDHELTQRENHPPSQTATQQDDSNRQLPTPKQPSHPNEHDDGHEYVSNDNQGIRAGGPLSVTCVPAVLRVDIIAACGLQAAVQEAAAWLGGGSALLGRAHQLGPHPFVVLNLFPADQKLSARVPALRTPFQAQSFCPKYDWHDEVVLQLDSHSLTALLTQQLCVEVWHHPSRSLAALAGKRGDDTQGVKLSTGGGGGGGSSVRPREVLLCSGGCALDKLLLHPQGIQSWVLLRSARGQPVGAVQLSLRFVSFGGQQVDACLAAPPPLAQYPNLATLLPADIPVPEMDMKSFLGQWCRATLFIEQAVVMAPMTTLPRAGSRTVQYYATYTMPGSDCEVMTAYQRPNNNNEGSSTGLGLNSKTSNNHTSPTHIPLKHVAVHWVKGDARLAGALARCPLKLKLWRVQEKSSGVGSSHQTAGLQHPGLSPSPSSSAAQLVGSVDIDTSHLVIRPPSSKPLPARWVSGTFHVIHPTATCYTPAQVRVKLLLELAPPCTPSSAVLAADSWQPGGEYASPPASTSNAPETPCELTPQDAVTVTQQKPEQSTSQENKQQLHGLTNVVKGLLPSQQQDSMAGTAAGNDDTADQYDSRSPVVATTQMPTNNLEGHRLPGQLPQIDMFSIARSTPTSAVAQHQLPPQRQSLPSHPVLGMTSPVHATTTFTIAAAESPPSSSTFLPELQRPETLRQDTGHQRQPSSELMDVHLATDNTTCTEDPAVRLRQQLQELDVLGLQWQRRLGNVQQMQDVFLERNAITDGGHMAGGIDEPVTTIAGMQMSNPAAAQQPTQSSAVSQAYSPDAHDAIQPIHTVGGNQHPDGLAQADGPGVRVATVRSLPQHDSPTARTRQAIPARHHIEVCSDDGGIDTVLGGYSASEADTDELLAGITVMHETHGGDADSNFGSPALPSSPNRRSYEARQAGMHDTTIQGSVDVVTQATVRQPAVPTSTHDDWLYTFSRPARALNNNLPIMHPCMMPPGLLATANTTTAEQHSSESLPTAIQYHARHEIPVEPPQPTISHTQHDEQDLQFSVPQHDARNGLDLSCTHQARRPQLGALQARLDALLSNFQADLRHTGMTTDLMLPARTGARYDSSDDDDLLIEQPGITTIHTSVGAQAGDAGSRPHFFNALPPLQADFDLQYSG